MALADPQSVTISGTAVPLPRTGLTLNEGRFTSATGEVNLSVMHSSSTNRVRHTVRLQKTTIVSDPLVPSQNQNVAYQVHVVFDTPKNGVSTADAAALGKALVAFLTDANIAKVVASES